MKWLNLILGTLQAADHENYDYENYRSRSKIPNYGPILDFTRNDIGKCKIKIVVFWLDNFVLYIKVIFKSLNSCLSSEDRAFDNYSMAKEISGLPENPEYAENYATYLCEAINQNDFYQNECDIIVKIVRYDSYKGSFSKPVILISSPYFVYNTDLLIKRQRFQNDNSTRII